MCPVTASANGKERLQTRDEAGGHWPATSVHVFCPHCGRSESDFHYHGQWLLMAGIFRTRNHSLMCVCMHHRPVAACPPPGWFYLSNVKVSTHSQRTEFKKRSQSIKEVAATGENRLKRQIRHRIHTLQAIGFPFLHLEKFEAARRGHCWI